MNAIKKTIMAKEDLLQEKVEQRPTIYAYEHPDYPQHKGWLKVGYTTRDVETRVKEQNQTAHTKYRIVRQWPAMRNDGTSFTDKKHVHPLLREAGVPNPEGEWFICNIEKVEQAVKSAQRGSDTMLTRTLSFGMRPEQKRFVDKTSDYFIHFAQDPNSQGLIPHFLWNAKMRFGKTFTTYQLARKMGWTKLLVLTFKPAVKTAWKEDLVTHEDFEGWQFCEKQENREFNTIDEQRPFVCFASFQDVLGRNAAGGIKANNEWIQTIAWDCIVLDEYHYGAWRKNARDFYNKKDPARVYAEEMEAMMAEDESSREREGREIYDEELMPLRTNAYLYLSGTPFRAINSGEFIEEQICNWTYSDEQKAKAAWQGGGNPYQSLPMMVMMTYQMPEKITAVASQGEFDEFDLNEFFRADENGFAHEEQVQKWLDLICGGYSENVVSELKQGTEKPPMPYSDVRLLGYLQHTFWFLPSVAACKAMKRLLANKANRFYHDYEVIVAAGNEAGMGAEALVPVFNAMKNPQETKSITLSCGKLSTGVTVKPWTGILMLRNTTSPETYFQTAFRVQSPWSVRDEEGKEVVLKQRCYVFDFAPNRALKLVAEYSCQLNVEESNPEKKVAEFIQFLPILSYDGSSMKEIDAAGVLDMAMSGTTATLLARRWESALLVNVDNNTLQRLMNNPEAMRALMNIEGFRSLRDDIETIINKSEHVKKTKREHGEDLTPKQKKELTDEEKEYKSRRKEIQEKLIKFATRIPVFMYLTDFREYCLRDVITQLEPELFRKVTGLTLKDFELLVSLGVFNSELMNDAVYKFKCYEDSSLSYTGIDTHNGTIIGLWDTALDVRRSEPEAVSINMEATVSVKESPQHWQEVKVGDVVEHKSIGNGRVTAIDDRYIFVQFADRERKFKYPEAFEKGYLFVRQAAGAESV